MAAHNELGRWGEDLAIDYLERKGYMILERDWKSGHRDIDIIARTADSIVFVEVKTRRNRDFGEPYEAINYSKQRNLIAAINHYIRYKRIDLNVRFDIISVVLHNTTEPEIQHIEDVRLI
ncbi:MAG: YraN family protein [Bacteroidaceae bacterium]|nr:YraN family protein [Bacteroidaceae bacterium]